MKNHLTIPCISLITLFLLSIFQTIQAQQIVNWVSLNLNNPIDLHVRNISVVDSNIIWGSFHAGDKAFRTIDGGESFEILTLPFSSNVRVIYDIFALNENIAFTATSTNTGGAVEGIHRTIDGGQNWELVFSNVGQQRFIKNVYFFNDQEGIIYGAKTNPIRSIFFYTNDGGDTWTKALNEFDITGIWTEGGNDGCTAVGDTIWCSSVPHQIFRSIDKGHSWTSHSAGFTTNVFNDIAFKNSTYGLALTSTNANGGDGTKTLYKTEDGGANWSFFKIISGGPDANNLSYIPGTTGGYIITSGNAPLNDDFRYSIDDGNTWIEATAPSPLTNAEFISPRIGFGGTETQNGGLLKYDDQVFETITSTTGEIHDKQELQLFPNPVSNTIHLQLKNEWQGNLLLRIFNSKGLEIYRTQLNKQDENLKWDFNTSNLQDNTYQLVISNQQEIIVQTFIKI